MDYYRHEVSVELSFNHSIGRATMPIPSPAFTLGLIVATIIGALAHLLMGGDGRRLLALIMAGWVGFAIGQGIGQVFTIRLLAIGPLNMLSALLGAVLATISTSILSAQHRGP